MASGGGFLQTMQEGGIFTLLVVVIGVFATLVAIGVLFAAFVAKNHTVVLALAGVSLMFGLLVVGLGGIGTLRGRAVVEEVLAVVQPEDRQAMADAGFREAAIPLRFGFYFGAFPLLASLIAAGIGATKSRTDDVG